MSTPPSDSGAYQDAGGHGPQVWRTADFAREADWRRQWSDLVGWGTRIAWRYAAFLRRRFFLEEQLSRLEQGTQFSKGRILHASWKSGSPIGGFALPLIGPRTPSPRTLIDSVTGSVRRSIAARLFAGDLDIAAYSGNWDIKNTGRYVPTRACVHCYWRLHSLPSVEDEWHILLICPLYDGIRSGMPFTADELCVEGRPRQDGGCEERNLQSLVSAILRTQRLQLIIDYVIKAFKIRRQHRKPPNTCRTPLRVAQ